LLVSGVDLHPLPVPFGVFAGDHRVRGRVLRIIEDRRAAGTGSTGLEVREIAVHLQQDICVAGLAVRRGQWRRTDAAARRTDLLPRWDDPDPLLIGQLVRGMAAMDGVN
jgi:hypothetical protein